MKFISRYRREKGKDPNEYFQIDRWGQIEVEAKDFFEKLRAEESKPFDCPFVRVVSEDFRLGDDVFEEGDIICLHSYQIGRYPDLCQIGEDPKQEIMRVDEKTGFIETSCRRIGGEAQVKLIIKEFIWKSRDGKLDVKEEFEEANRRFRENFKKKQEGNLFSCFSELEK